MRCVNTLAVMLVLLAVPLATAQGTGSQADVREGILATPGTPITFYGHLFEQTNGAVTVPHPMPMNTQFPDGEEDYSIGYGGGCGNAPPLPDDGADCEDWVGNELYFFTTAGFVQVKSREEFINNGRYEQLHNERGQTKDIYFDTSQPAEAVLHMSADFHGWLVALCTTLCWNWDPGMYEDWVVEAWLWRAPLGEHGADASSQPDMMPIHNRQAGTLMAHGATEPRDMISFDPTLPLETVCGGECYTVNEFVVPLEWEPDFANAGGVMPKGDDFILEFEWYQLTDGQKYIQGSGPVGIVWNLNGGEDYPNRLVLPVRNPLDVEVVFPTFVHDKLVILSVINTPWGSYDIDQEATKLTVRDASGNVVPIDPDTISGGLDVSVSHAGHYMPIEGQWVWDYQAQGLDPGKYTIEVEATNFQHSYTSSTVANFTIDASGKGISADTGRSGLNSFDKKLEVPAGEGSETEGDVSPAKDSPGVGVALTLLAAAVVTAGRRRS